MYYPNDFFPRNNPSPQNQTDLLSNGDNTMLDENASEVQDSTPAFSWVAILIVLVLIRVVYELME